MPALIRLAHYLYSHGTIVTILYRWSTVYLGKTIIRRITAGIVLKIPRCRPHSWGFYFIKVINTVRAAGIKLIIMHVVYHSLNKRIQSLITGMKMQGWEYGRHKL